MPRAVKCGIKPREFMHMTPNEVNMIIKAQGEQLRERADEREFTAWLNGLYVSMAIASCFSKKCNYPENPITKKQDSLEVKAQKAGKTEEEIQQELLYMQLRVMQANYELESVE